MKEERIKTFPWTCPACKEVNNTEYHSIGTHFPSVVCEYCEYEMEGCPCKEPPIAETIKNFLAAGFNSKEIAKRLNISRMTVQRYRKKFRDEFKNK